MNLDSKNATPLDQRFGEVIRTESDLRNIVGPANRWFTSKILSRLDRRCQEFIAPDLCFDAVFAQRGARGDNPKNSHETIKHRRTS
jgi:hypothetical protein